MSTTVVLVANEPRAYREVVAIALRDLCPTAAVVAVEPDGLDAEVVRRRPDVVVCSRLSEAVETRVPVWVVLYPEGANVAVFSVLGKRETSIGPTLDGLAAFVNRTDLLARRSDPHPRHGAGGDGSSQAISAPIDRSAAGAAPQSVSAARPLATRISTAEASSTGMTPNGPARTAASPIPISMKNPWTAS